jgi:DNA-binding response OmpR family regulator
MERKIIALVEDDADIAYSIRFNLEKTGLYQLRCYGRGSQVLDAVGTERFDLVLLDLNLPDTDGLTVCQELRAAEETRRVPILMLTARVTERDRVRGLNLGADDYVTKPFSMPELLARIAAHLRRAALDDPKGEKSWSDGSLLVDDWNHRVESNGEEVHLTKKEFELLWLLVASRPRVLSRDAILTKVWSWDTSIDPRTIDVHVRSLRKKIGEGYIETVVGLGYRFREGARNDAAAD